MTVRQQLSAPAQETGGGSGEGLFSRRGAIWCTAAHAIAGVSLPYAAPSDVGAVHHDMSLDARAIRRTGLLFFCGAPVSRGNLELTSRSLRPWRAGVPASAPCKCDVQSITRLASIRGRIPPRHRLAVRHLVRSFFLYQRALKAAAHSGMPRGLDPLFIALNRSANAATTISRSRSGA